MKKPSENRAYALVASPLGPLLLTATDAGLAGLYTDAQAAQREPGGDGWREDRALLVDAERELGEYFAGAREAFDLPLDTDQGTPFQRDVWSALRAIPYGEVVSYGEIARRIGRPSAVRAVGAAIGRNPWGIVVPCHRVVGQGGALTGFAGGLPRKRWLLEHEGMRVVRREGARERDDRVAPVPTLSA